MAKALAKQNVLLLATGCASGAFGRHGIFTQEAVGLYAGDGLKAVLTAVGEANGLGGPLPLALHMGSCVDNTRAADVAVAVANYLGVDLDKLPVVATAPEAAMEKAVSIGTWAVAMGLPTHVGIVPPVLGSPAVAGLLTGGLKDVVGGWFIVETDPVVAAQKLVDAIVERRSRPRAAGARERGRRWLGGGVMSLLQKTVAAARAGRGAQAPLRHPRAVHRLPVCEIACAVEHSDNEEPVRRHHRRRRLRAGASSWKRSTLAGVPVACHHCDEAFCAERLHHRRHPPRRPRLRRARRRRAASAATRASCSARSA